MGHDKLRKFAENETFSCLLQPSAAELLADGFFALRDHAVKGHWNGTMFDAARPVVLELGCGKGEYTIDLSRREPSCNYIGVDIKGARLWKGAKYAHEHQLGNVAFLRTRIEFIGAFFAPSEVSQIWLTFSDPQLKSENSRLTSPVFLERYRQFLQPGGIVHLKTDSRFLYEYSLAVARCNGLRVLAATPDLYATPREELFGAGMRQSGTGLQRAESFTPSGECTLQSGAALPPAGVPAGGDGASAGAFHEGSQSAPAAALSLPAVNALYEVQTFYERMFRAQGYKICYLAFTLDHEGPFEHPTLEEFDPVYWRSVEGPRHFATPPDTIVAAGTAADAAAAVVAAGSAADAAAAVVAAGSAADAAENGTAAGAAEVGVAAK